MREALANLNRYIGTPRVAKHRLFAWLDAKVLPDCQIVVIARSDDTTFGILHSRFHELWSLGLCTWMGVGNDPRYTPSTTFETFPFPAGMTPADTAAGAPEGPAAEAIAAAARRLDELRSNWLNPADWVDWVVTPEEAAAGFPARPVARPGHEAELKKRTLTNLYNQRPAWLANAHQALDQAVAAAYGWADYSPAMADDEILRRLLKLNLDRA
jgi:type II restriction/modification system DNA methylase subunit YeeA